MLAMLQTASLGYALEQVVQPVSIKGVATRPRVLLFLHVGKCGGESTRSGSQMRRLPSPLHSGLPGPGAGV